MTVKLSDELPELDPGLNLETGTYFGYELASRWERFLGFLAHLVLNIFIFAGILIIFDRGGIEFEFGIIGSSLTTGIINGLLYYFWSGNFGHKLFGLKVVSSKDGKDLQNPFWGIIREFLKNLQGYLLLPLIWVLWDKNTQNLYDKNISTIVVRKPAGRLRRFSRGVFKYFVTLLLLFSCSVVGFVIPILAIPATAKYLADKYPKSAKIKLAKEMRSNYKSSIDHRQSELLTAFARRALGVDKTIYVIEGDEINAIAAPSNYIFIPKGILFEVDSYPELAALIAHEHVHIHRNHFIQKRLTERGLDIYSSFWNPDDDLDVELPSSYKQFLCLYSQKFEKEADLGAIRILYLQDIDPRGMIRLLHIMRLAESKHHGSHCRNHPEPLDRIEYVNNRIFNQRYQEPKPKMSLEKLFRKIKALNRF